jgi:hypothetical protein
MIESLLLAVFVFLVGLFIYGLLERRLIRKQVQQEINQVLIDILWNDYSCQELLVSLWNTKYLRRIEGIQGVVKQLCSGHKQRAYNKLIDLNGAWTNKGFEILRGRNLLVKESI